MLSAHTINIPHQNQCKAWLSLWASLRSKALPLSHKLEHGRSTANTHTDVHTLQARCTSHSDCCNLGLLLKISTEAVILMICAGKYFLYQNYSFNLINIKSGGGRCVLVFEGEKWKPHCGVQVLAQLWNLGMLCNTQFVIDFQPLEVHQNEKWSQNLVPGDVAP